MGMPCRRRRAATRQDGIHSLPPGSLADRSLNVVALLSEVGQLLEWGIAVGRRLGWSRSASLLAGLVDGTLGVVIVGLKVLLQN